MTRESIASKPYHCIACMLLSSSVDIVSAKLAINLMFCRYEADADALMSLLALQPLLEGSSGHVVAAVCYLGLTLTHSCKPMK